MADNTNVNNNAAVVVVGRTAPVPPGQQKSEKSIPVVIANDQSTIPVAEQNKIQSEVALSLLGIPRSEVALGIFADVNTYDVNPTEWTATPENYETVQGPNSDGTGTITYGHGLTHVPEESGALVESPIDETAILTSKRFFRYQPGRVSAATFGVKTSGPGFGTASDSAKGVGISNPAIRKYGIFDKFDGYYWETRNGGGGDNFCVVRRTQSLTYDNPIEYGVGSNQQQEDYGCTNPLDQTAPRGSETERKDGAPTTTFGGYKEKKFGDLVLVRDKLLMIHAGAYDPTLLQPKTENKIGGITATSNSIALPGLGKTISGAQYSITSGLMNITTTEPHGFYRGKYITLAGIGMTCYLAYNVSESVTNAGADYSVSSTPLATGAGSISGATDLKVKITSVTGSGVDGVDVDGEAKYALRNYADGDVILITGGGNGLAAITISKTLDTSKIKYYPLTDPTNNATGTNNNLGNANDLSLIHISEPTRPY